ncbi:MAG TPA: hypothetical protein VNH11_28595 [Pirellulales bacterium]|nr:hypothetical protein [Pirellulales bacterium]
MNVALSWALSLVMLAGSAEPPEWMNDYGAALQAARRAQMPLLVVLDQPAQRAVHFDAVGLDDRQATHRLLARYKLCRVDVATPYGQAVAKAFRASEFPTTVIIDKTAQVQLFATTGTLGNGDLRAVLAKYQTGERHLVEILREPAACFT